MSHYFLLLSLPPLSLKVKPDISYAELKDLLLLNLSESEYRTIFSVFEENDLYHLKAFWLGLTFQEEGVFDPSTIEERLLVQENLPLYLTDFLGKYETNQEKALHFNELLASFYREKEEGKEGFLRDWFSFERSVRLYLTAFRAKTLGRDLSKELQFEDPKDATVAFLIAQKEGSELFVPNEWESLRNLFVQNGQDPEKLHEALLEYRFEKLEELEEKMVPFSFDQVLSYVAKFLLVERFFGQGDREKGYLALEELSKYG